MELVHVPRSDPILFCCTPNPNPRVRTLLNSSAGSNRKLSLWNPLSSLMGIES